MTIEVTQAHIDKGETKNIYSCPVALALKDRGFPKSTVGMTFCIIDPMSTQQIFFPGQVCNFISAFDKGKPVEPFTFELET